MSGKYGVEQIKVVAVFAVGLANCAIKAEHASGTIGKVSAFFPIVTEAPALLHLDRTELMAEWNELDEGDRAEVYAACAEKFDLGDKDLEGKVERLLEAGLKIADGVTEAVAALTDKGAAA